jgi:hypothetical protein
VIGRSFGSKTYDIAAGNANEPGQVLQSVRPELLKKAETASE